MTMTTDRRSSVWTACASGAYNTSQFVHSRLGNRESAIWPLQVTNDVLSYLWLNARDYYSVRSNALDTRVADEISTVVADTVGASPSPPPPQSTSFFGRRGGGSSNDDGDGSPYVFRATARHRYRNIALSIDDLLRRHTTAKSAASLWVPTAHMAPDEMKLSVETEETTTVNSSSSLAAAAETTNAPTSGGSGVTADNFASDCARFFDTFDDNGGGGDDDADAVDNVALCD